MPLSVDVAVIGAGVNGAVAAWLLGRAGLRVAVVDVNALPGGLAGGRVSHGAPGGRYAYALGLVPREVWRLLGVDPDSLYLPDPSWVELGADGSPVLRWWSSPGRLRVELREAGLEGVWGLLLDSSRLLRCLAEEGMYYTPCPPSRSEAATGLPRGCPQGILGTPTRRVLASSAPRRAWDLLIYPSMLDSDGFALAYYLQNMNIWAQPPGGSMMWLSRLLLRLLRGAGVYLVQGRADAILVEHGRAVGVALRDGRTVRARAVLYAASLPALPRLGGVDRGVPEADLRALESLAERKSWVTRVDFYTRSPPRPPREEGWRGVPIYVYWPGGGGEYTYPGLIADPGRGGLYLVQASGSPVGITPPGVVEEGIAAVEEHGPGSQDRCCMNPTGHPDHIPMIDPFLYDTRPLPGWGDYTTPLPGLYHGSASSYPGGEVNMVAGINAAIRILLDMGHVEPWRLLGPLAAYARRGMERCRRGRPP